MTTELICAECKKPLAHVLEWHPQEACERWRELSAPLSATPDAEETTDGAR